MSGSPPRAAMSKRGPKLDFRQKMEIIRLLAAGHSSRQICRELAGQVTLTKAAVDYYQRKYRDQIRRAWQEYMARRQRGE